MAQSERLRVVVVGGGIGGLAAARILREKHDVTIYEKEAQRSEGGAALALGPNGSKLAKRMGLDPTRAGAVSCQGMRTFNMKGDVLSERKTQCKERYGSEWLMFHRLDLWDEYCRLATGPASDIGISGEPAKLIYNIAASEVDCELGKIVLSDGSVIEADLIVGKPPLIILF
jgi:salicylate hydroxylase